MMMRIVSLPALLRSAMNSLLWQTFPDQGMHCFSFFAFSCDPMSMKVVEPVEPGRDQGEEQAKDCSKEAKRWENCCTLGLGGAENWGKVTGERLI